MIPAAEERGVKKSPKMGERGKTRKRRFEKGVKLSSEDAMLDVCTMWSTNSGAKVVVNLLMVKSVNLYGFVLDTIEKVRIFSGEESTFPPSKSVSY